MATDMGESVEKLHTALELFELGCGIMLQNIRRENPDLPADQIDELFESWLQSMPSPVNASVHSTEDRLE